MGTTLWLAGACASAGSGELANGRDDPNDGASASEDDAPPDSTTTTTSLPYEPPTTTSTLPPYEPPSTTTTLPPYEPPTTTTSVPPYEPPEVDTYPTAEDCEALAELNRMYEELDLDIPPHDLSDC